MSINWQEAEEKPDKKQKIDGKELIGLRELTNNLERELIETKDELSHTKEILEQISRDLEESERKAAEKEKANEDLVSQILELNQTLESYATQIKDLEISLDKLSSISYDYNEEIANLKLKLDHSNQKLKEAHQTINKQEGRISALSAQLEEKKMIVPKTDQKDQKISELSLQLQEKDSEISELTSQLEGKSTALKNLILKMEKSDHPIDELYNPPPEVEIEEPTAIDERVRCPKCGAFGRDLKTMEDRSKVLRYQGQMRIYAKKRVCKKCGTEF